MNGPQQMPPVNHPQQAQPQAGRGQQQSQAGGIYPGNMAEAVRFSNNILEELYKGGDEGPTISALRNMPENMPPEKGVGMIAGKIVGTMLGQMKGSTGKRPAMKVAFGATKKAVDELIEIATAQGKTGIDKSVAEAAIGVATEIVDDMVNGGQQQPQEQQAQPQPQQAQQMPQMPAAGQGVA